VSDVEISGDIEEILFFVHFRFKATPHS